MLNFVVRQCHTKIWANALCRLWHNNTETCCGLTRGTTVGAKFHRTDLDDE